jgi:hypothetical protein
LPLSGQAPNLQPTASQASGSNFSVIINIGWTGGVAQAVERLLCKHEALSSLYTLVSFPSLKKVTKHLINNLKEARRQWLTPVILATWEAEIRRIMVRGQPRQIA